MPVPLVLAHLPLVACVDQVLPGRKYYKLPQTLLPLVWTGHYHELSIYLYELAFAFT
jgi:hypothetical protein